MDVPIHYDPMISKLIIWGPDRETAIRRAGRALREYAILGTQTSIPFFLALFEDEGFRRGDYDTGFITQEWLEEQLAGDASPPDERSSSPLWRPLSIAAQRPGRRRQRDPTGRAAGAAAGCHEGPCTRRNTAARHLGPTDRRRSVRGDSGWRNAGPERTSPARR